MISAAVMPLLPLSPTLTSTSDERISVMSVMPDTGFEPTMAMALAATVVKRKAMTKTIRMAVTDCSRLPPSTPKWKNTKVAISAATSTESTRFIVRSRCVRSCVSVALRPPSSFTARAYGLADDARLAHDADQARHGDAADSERFADVLEEILGREQRVGLREDLLARDAQQGGQRRGVDAAGERAHERHDDEPHQARARGDDEGVFESDDVAQTEQRRRGVEAEDDLELVGRRGAPGAQTGRYRLGPEAERADHEVVESAREARYGQQLGLVAAPSRPRRAPRWWP